MKGLGLVTSRLPRMHEVLDGHVKRRAMPGLVAMLACGEELHVETLGTLAFDAPAPMRQDTIFRVASLTKPVVAVAAMILLEECRLRLDDPIDRWLPELANRRVLRSIGSEPEDTVPAVRAITVRDLLTYRMGLGSVMAAPDTYPIQRLLRENQIGGDGPPRPAQGPTQDEWLRRLGTLPWMAQPGERWLYHTSGDVLGVLVARVSGQSLGTFLQERLFAPLGMTNTGFAVTAETAARLPTCYRSGAPLGTLAVYDDATQSAWLGEPPLQSGGGGLLSTAEDYLAFCRMLLHKGRHGAEHILSRATVELMTSDQLTPEQRAGSEIFFGDFSSWGFGVAVDTARREIFHSPGRFGWTGGLGTTAYIDPANDTVGLLFTQRMMDSPAGPEVFHDFWTSAYAALA